MKIKKITLLLFLVFFICGCTAKYDLDIKENSFTENLEISATSNETLYKYTLDNGLDVIIIPKKECTKKYAILLRILVL